MTDLTALLILILVAGREAWALGTPVPGDEWTGYARRIRDSGLLGALVIGGGSFWLAYHFAIDVEPGQGWPDVVAILLGYLAVKWRGPVRYRSPGNAE